MAINFCKKCGNFMSPKNTNETICSRCGLLQKSNNELISKEQIQKKDDVAEGIVSDENIYATYDNICKKCGYGKAQVIDLGVKYSDEDNLFFLKCGKCGFSQRIGRKTD